MSTIKLELKIETNEDLTEEEGKILCAEIEDLLHLHHACIGLMQMSKKLGETIACEVI